MQNLKSGINLLARFAAILLGLQSCATLPDAEQQMSVAHTQQVAFEDAHGKVTTARSDAILTQLEGPEGPTDILQKHLAYEQAVNAHSPLVLGNKLTLLQNGPETYESMFEAIRAARDHINLETYIFADDEIGQQFADLLLERQAAGVQVNIIQDSGGSFDTPNAFFERMRDAGINVLEFNPINPFAGNKTAWLLNNRDHRKQLIIDGRIAFTGGINLTDVYLASPPDGSSSSSSSSSSSGSKNNIDQARVETTEESVSWRDTHIRIEGPVVAEFQKLFMDTWARQNGTPLTVRNYFPELEIAGDEIVRAIGSTPDDPFSPIYMTLISSITHAELKVHLTIAYFAPDPQLLEALISAAERDVDVRLILPGYTESSATIFHLGRSYYSKLLRGGVRIYERQGSLMHAKTATIDDVWSTIGSTNMDWRSFLHNDEINAVILGRGFATQMEAMFAQDLAETDAVVLSQWRQRPFRMRWKERIARISAYWQ